MQAVPLLSHSIYVLHYFGLEVHETFTLKLIVTNIVCLSIRSSTRVVVVFACFLSSVSLLLLQVTRPSSVAATEAPPAPPRMEPERSHQNSKGNCQNGVWRPSCEGEEINIGAQDLPRRFSNKRPRLSVDMPEVDKSLPRAQVA